MDILQLFLASLEEEAKNLSEVIPYLLIIGLALYALTIVRNLRKYRSDIMSNFTTFDNGWAVDIALGPTTLGLELAVLKYRERKPKRLERIADIIRGKKNERLEATFVNEDVVKHPKFQDGVYAYLDPKERDEIIERVKKLDRWKEWSEDKPKGDIKA